MSSGQTFSTNDLRSGAKEFSRDKNHRVKWAHGQSFGPGRRVEDARPRPARVNRIIPTPKTYITAHKFRTVLEKDIASASGESSADEEIEEPSAAPSPDAEVAYSFDAARGPSQGSQVLGQALTQAIERFEVRQTDKLIKEEYEVLDADGEPVFQSRKPNKKNASSEDEEYEFVEV